MNGIGESKNRSLSSDHPVNPVHPVQSLNIHSGAKRRSLDRINKMNGIGESKNRSLSSDHPVNPVNPVHPVQSLNFPSGAKRRNFIPMSVLDFRTLSLEVALDPNLSRPEAGRQSGFEL